MANTLRLTHAPSPNTWRRCGEGEHLATPNLGCQERALTSYLAEVDRAYENLQKSGKGYGMGGRRELPKPAFSPRASTLAPSATADGPEPIIFHQTPESLRVVAPAPTPQTILMKSAAPRHRTCTAFTPLSAISPRGEPTRQSISCRQREGWRPSGNESCVTDTRSSNTNEVGRPLQYSTSCREQGYPNRKQSQKLARSWARSQATSC